MPTKIPVPTGLRINFSRKGGYGQEKTAYRTRKFIRSYFGSALKVELDPNDGYGQIFVIKDVANPEEYFSWEPKTGCGGTSGILTFPPSDRKMLRFCSYLERRGLKPARGHPRPYVEDDMCQVPVCAVM